MKLFLTRSANRANLCASTALCAGLGIDNVLAVTFGNCANRAATCASAAGNTFIANYVCQRKHLQ